MKFTQIKEIFPDSTVSRYNVAVWQKPGEDSLYFIGREVAQPGKLGEPDSGTLILFEVDANGVVVNQKTIWKPIFEGINLEDPRALKLPGENLTVGLTAVLRDKKGIATPFPAIVTIDSLRSWKQELPPFLIIDTFGSGKNITPIRKHTYLFRPDAPEYFHKLLVFSLHSQIPEKICDIAFPKTIAWATWRIGTTMPPIWFNRTEALFIIHGITLQSIRGSEKYVYSIGRAKLSRHDDSFSVMIEPEPILTPDDFVNAEGDPLVNELHPELRRVVYCCGGVIKKKSPTMLSLYVNVGDRATFEVELPLAELKKGLF